MWLHFFCSLEDSHESIEPYVIIDLVVVLLFFCSVEVSLENIGPSMVIIRVFVLFSYDKLSHHVRIKIHYLQ